MDQSLRVGTRMSLSDIRKGTRLVGDTVKGTGPVRYREEKLKLS